MELFSDILPTPTPISVVVDQVVRSITPSHHPEGPKPTRSPTGRLGLPPSRMNPWQRAGRTLLAEATTDPAIAIRQAGLNWKIERVDLRCADTLDPLPKDFAAIRRSDTGRILGVVGSDYEPFQNRAMFDVFTDLAQVGKDDGGLPFTIETAGAFTGGKVVWALAHLPDLGIRIGDDEAKTYLLVSNGHTGNRTLIIAPTTVRVICQNTLAMAEAQAKANRKLGLAGGFTLKHTHGIHAAVNEAKAAFAATIASHAATKAAWNRLADVPLTSRLETGFMAQVFGKAGPDEADRAKSLRKSREERIAAILASPTSQVRGTKDSLFSLMQAIVEYADHDRTTRTTDGGDTEESRLMSATFGSGAELKAKAWDSAMMVAG